MSLVLKCDYRGIDNVRFSRRATQGLVVGVTRTNEDSNILLSDKDVERLYEYLGEHLGKKEESSVKANIKSVEGAEEILDMKFRCTSDPSDTLETSFDSNDEELYIRTEMDDEVTAIYLSSEDALTLANNIIKAFGGN